MLTYGDREFTWNTGRNLEKITDGSNEYSYTYDENGIRTSKTVNGVTTYYNTKDGVILSQTDGTNTMYFQYDTNGMPIGFIYNGIQYFYMTNQMGDVISITDAQGNEIVEYEYDEWGGIASISSIGDLESGIVLANANPIRYRGYYFDNETGYYYLQSRYYDPSICRFINADIPEVAETSKDIIDGMNLFAYCSDNPVNYMDNDGYWKKDNHYSWTLSWINYWKNTNKYIKKLGSYSISIAYYCKRLDETFPSTYYALHRKNTASKQWQYYHFNGNSVGTDSRIIYSNYMLNNAVSSWKYNKNKALMYLGYGLHAIQDIEAHGQIGRGYSIPAHGVTADSENYVWADRAHKDLRFKRKRDRSRKDDTKDATYNYLKRFCVRIWGY